MMPRGSVRSAVSAVSGGSSNGRGGDGESVVFCLDNEPRVVNGGVNGVNGGGEKSVKSARSVRSERSERYSGYAAAGAAEERGRRERERESFVGAVKGRAGVRLSAVGSVGGEGFGW